MTEELLLTKKKKMRREGALLSGAFKLTHPALAKLWEESDRTQANTPESHVPRFSAPDNTGGLPKPEFGRYSNAKASVDSASSYASTKARFSWSSLPQAPHPSSSASSQSLARAPRPLGVPRYQQSAANKPQVPQSEESAPNFSLPLPELPTKKSITNAEKRSRKISSVAAPPTASGSPVKPPVSPSHMATVLEEEPVPPPLPDSEGLPRLDEEEGGSMDMLNLYLEELSKSPHFEEYLRLIQQEATEPEGTRLTKPFTFSYFDLHKLA